MSKEKEVSFEETMQQLESERLSAAEIIAIAEEQKEILEQMRNLFIII